MNRSVLEADDCPARPQSRRAAAALSRAAIEKLQRAIPGDAEPNSSDEAEEANPPGQSNFIDPEAADSGRSTTGQTQRQRQIVQFPLHDRHLERLTDKIREIVESNEECRIWFSDFVLYFANKNTKVAHMMSGPVGAALPALYDDFHAQWQTCIDERHAIPDQVFIDLAKKPVVVAKRAADLVNRGVPPFNLGAGPKSSAATWAESRLRLRRHRPFAGRSEGSTSPEKTPVSGETPGPEAVPDDSTTENTESSDSPDNESRSTMDGSDTSEAGAPAGPTVPIATFYPWAMTSPAGSVTIESAAGGSDEAGGLIYSQLDLEVPGPANRRTVDVVQAAVDDGKIAVQDLDARVMAVLKLLRKTGKFTDRRDPVPERAIQLPGHNALIREAGAEGIVLLKNDSGTLPLRAEGLKKVAILGPLAKEHIAHGGGSAALTAHYKTTPFDAITERFGECEITYSKGAHVYSALPDWNDGLLNADGEAGWTGAFYHSTDLSGEPYHDESFSRGTFVTITSPECNAARSARWSACFTPQSTSNHYITFAGLGPSKLFIDGTLVGSAREADDTVLVFMGAQEKERFRYMFTASREYKVAFESCVSPVDNSDLVILKDKVGGHIGFLSQQDMEADLFFEVVQLAKDADVAICFIGNTAQWETEGIDMLDMKLPADGTQDRFVAAVCEANKNTVVCISTGVAVELPWLEKAPAVMQSFYAGQEAGNAIVDILLGNVNPSGHFGRNSWDSREAEFVEGVYVGYRHFDRLYETDKEVLFPFGHGLSYTTFEISGTAVLGSVSQAVADAKVEVTATVSNTGDRDGSQVVQVYLAPPKGGDTGRPPKSLVGFTKVYPTAGQMKTVVVSFQRDAAAFWAEDGHCWRVEGGEHQILVSTSSAPGDIVSTLGWTIEEGFDFR
ncbi:glycosyl hydrolase family 3 C-terminal domain-containing protein [Plectosphaerella plurivora]|uniref:beta-glucosidase n=1 Tax=Plectosphaerella plurivora TaxID=936078 RepID=A0A9P9A5I8_9PEZI|nr:glycosyl hydrolase family 3 C-terminal domain-containing protein [Plectosphaerella plurivora]